MESLWRILEKREQGRNGVYLNNPSDSLQEIHRDVIVVGAGMAGILTAFYLKEQGKSVLVLEADELASGQTRGTTAKITSQHGIKYSTLIKTVGKKKARLYAQANEEAIEEFERLIREKKIDCQFERVPAYLYTLQNKEALEKEAQVAAELGIDAYFTRETELIFPVEGAVCFQNQAQFSPLDFLRGISAELEIIEHVKVTKIRGNRVATKRGILSADAIVVATHYPLLNVPGFYFLRQHQERSYMLALSGCRRLKGMYYGIDKNGRTLRQAGDYLLFGGNARRTGENENGGVYEELLVAARQYFPECRELTRWSAQDCMPHDGIPFIGRYSVFTPHLYVATGFQKWGMTSSMIAAMLLRDEICGIENPYDKLFSPRRLNFRASIGNLLQDVGMSAKGLLRGAFHKPKESAGSLLNRQGGIVIIDGAAHAAYRDEEGELHIFSKRCAHMGCELTWNPDEQSWDCPCHGSRFDADGRLLDNPSKSGMKKQADGKTE